ncbi:MFS transporter [filamentous cyanobacterium LEGE 11480]|uniref:MFS transporter n=1 Tax=Romeriopsis navalis LEGE 11480 TaxID=2777977 RepID=A0A928VKB7_9CYAN|nr:MFS transporter [Romeriopsis navalis]MBE9030193.1 MFS transporter [Romeriopsis navalis LEGE 11480]
MQDPAASPPAEKLSFATKLAYGAGDMGPAMTANLLAFFLMFFFTNVAGMNPALAGSVLMIGKIFDAINDPIVGVMSDRTKSKWGRRLPWMLYGALPFGIIFFLQWIVPQFSRDPNMNQWWLFAYYVAIGIIFNIFYTIVNLPYTALTPEVTQDYNERTNLNTFRFFFSIGGSILSLIVAQIIFLTFKTSPTSTQYLLLGLVTAVMSTLPLYWCVFGVKRRVLNAERQRVASQTALEEPIPIGQQIKIALNNRPFQFVIGIYFCSWLAVQMTASIIPYYVINYMKLSEAQFTQVMIAVQGTALAMLFVWERVSRRYGKKVVYFLGNGFWLIAQFGLFLIKPDQVPLMYFLAVLAGFGVSVAYLVPWSMVPDVIEWDELETGQRREGVFYAFMVLLQKFGLALGLFLLGQGLAFAGFREKTGSVMPEQPDSAIDAIRWAIGPIPTAILLAGLCLAYFYPITKEKHQEILLQLAERKRNQAGPGNTSAEDNG